MSRLKPPNLLGKARQHGSCALYLSDNDVFSGLSSKRIPNPRGNLEAPERPFLYDVICNQRGRWVQTCNAIGAGGARRVRTDDLMLAKHALYQLSYGPLSVEPARWEPSMIPLGW